MTGEEQHAKGTDGARRAKRWLEATTRAEAKWVNPQPLALRKLTFAWANGGAFSFDLGGVLRGGEVDGEEFLAECKMYARAHDQGTEYVKYLAKCYRAYQTMPTRCDNFMWVTWSAFATKTWDELLTADAVRNAVAKHAMRAIGEEAVESSIDNDIIRAVAERLWLIVLSERQEKHLVLTDEHRAVVEAFIVNQGGASAGL